MRIIDLSPVIDAKTLIYPGDKAFSMTQVVDEGFCTASFEMSLHTGSHADFARHCLLEGEDSGEVSLEKFIGEAVCLNLSANLDEAIKFYLPKNPKKAKILLLNVKFDFKNSDEFFTKSPFLDEDFLNLAHKNGFHTIATNLSTIDRHGLNDRHIEAFNLKIQIIESLVNLDSINAGSFFFSAAPLKISNADAAPLRAYAIV